MYLRDGRNKIVKLFEDKYIELTGFPYNVKQEPESESETKYELEYEKKYEPEFEKKNYCRKKTITTRRYRSA